MTEAGPADPRLARVTRCPDCAGALAFERDSFVCAGCQRVYGCDREGVWDFRPSPGVEDGPALYREAEFQRWLTIFGKQESADWVIYSNPVFRWFSQAGHRLTARRVRAGLGERPRVLEIGAGSGALLDHVQPDDYTAVEVSVDSLHRLKRRHEGALAIAASATRLPFASGAFDQIVSLHALEHIYHLAEALDECGRVLEPRGCLHYVIPTEGGAAFALGRALVTGPHLKRKYALDVGYVMAREHINDAPRVLKFLRMTFTSVENRFWPLSPLALLSTNAMIYGCCQGWRHRGDEA